MHAKVVMWRGESIIPVVSGEWWYLIRDTELFKGPPMVLDEAWNDLTARLQASLDETFRDEKPSPNM